MKKKKTIYQRLNKFQQQHIADCYEGPPSRITLTRIKNCLTEQIATNFNCWICRGIARTLKINLED